MIPVYTVGVDTEKRGSSTCQYFDRVYTQRCLGSSFTNTRGDMYTTTRGIHVGYVPIEGSIPGVPRDSGRRASALHSPLLESSVPRTIDSTAAYPSWLRTVSWGCIQVCTPRGTGITLLSENFSDPRISLARPALAVYCFRHDPLEGCRLRSTSPLHLFY